MTDFFNNPALHSDPTIYAIPVFISLIVLEVFFDIKRKLKLYDLKDSAACITMGLGVVVIGILTKSFAYFLYTFLYQYRLFDIPNTWWTWLLLVFCDDFSFYWHHRISHTVRFLWAAHIQHHSSTKMNLSVALRQSWGEPFYKYLFYIWMPLVGFNPLWIMVMQAISLIYQFFQHTELVHKLGPLELIFNTPSHHRVHHATQIHYLDKNHAGIFIIWDKIFDTFEEEKEPPIYGITTNITTHNPLIIATHEYHSLWNDIKRAKKWSDKFRYIIYPPGWNHDGQNNTSKFLQKQNKLKN